MGYQTKPSDTVVKLRAHQEALVRNRPRFFVPVLHRRAGKTYALVLRQLILAMNGPPDWQSAYIAPTLKQARTICEPYLLAFAAPLGGTYNKSETTMTIGTKKLFLASGENYERLRGLYLDDVVIDEAAQVPTAAWTQVISPAISDRGGSAVFSGTPAGHQNLLYRMFKHAQEADDPDFGSMLMTYKDTGALPELEVARMRRQMSTEEFQQELECSFSGALRGAYYARQMQELLTSGQVIDTIEYEPELPVYASLDLGHSNATVITVAQRAGQQRRILFSEAYVGSSFPEMVRRWKELPFPIDELILPHDARVTELGTGKTRQETLEGLGMRTSIAPKQSIDEGIDQVRRALKNTWFKTSGTVMLREALQSYRAEFDDVRQVHRLKPLHDWSSDWADSFRYLIQGEPGQAGTWGERPSLRGTI